MATPDLILVDVLSSYVFYIRTSPSSYQVETGLISILQSQTEHTMGSPASDACCARLPFDGPMEDWPCVGPHVPWRIDSNRRHGLPLLVDQMD